MDIALSILIPVCVTALTITKWVVRPKTDDKQLRTLEMQMLKWAADNYNYNQTARARSIMAYFHRWYPDGPEGEG